MITLQKKSGKLSTRVGEGKISSASRGGLIYKVSLSWRKKEIERKCVIRFSHLFFIMNIIRLIFIK